MFWLKTNCWDCKEVFKDWGKIFSTIVGVWDNSDPLFFAWALKNYFIPVILG